MKHTHDTQKIELLLSRFMAGESTLDEERILTDYFRTADVCPEWKEYKEMFALFDAGEVDVENVEQDSPQRISTITEKPRIIMLRWFVSGIAASIAILFGIYTYIINKGASETPLSVAQIVDTVRHCTQTEQQLCQASIAQERLLPAESDGNVVAAQTKRTNTAVTRQHAKNTDSSRQRLLEAERIMRLLDDADNAFAQATIQCAMDINESFLQDETFEETDHETNIVI